MAKALKHAKVWIEPTPEELEGMSEKEFDVLCQRLKKDQPKPANNDTTIAESNKTEASASSDDKGAQPESPDYLHWARMQLWTLDQAAVLLLGKDPHWRTDWPKFAGEHRYVNAFAAEYLKLRELLQNACNAGLLKPAPEKSMVLDWAKSMQLEIPSELQVAVDKIGSVSSIKFAGTAGMIALHEELKTELENHIAVLEGDNKALREQVAQLEGVARDLGPRERDTLMKLVIGMAMKGYGYDPHADRSDATGDIRNDLAALGVPLDHNTILKWLRNSADEALPGEPEPE
ncbi:MAG: hypothetical protein MI824_15085 [Hyphomicrobiales bacterium]|nr:hypothetical protein [Hyphomicrobiales bacterium]